MANALDDPDTAETWAFVRNFGSLCQCLMHTRKYPKRKPDLHPYRDPSDSRLTVFSLTHINSVVEGRVPRLS